MSLAAKIFVPRLLFLIFDPKGKTGSALVCVTSPSQAHTDLQIFSFLDTPTSLGLGPVSATKSFIVSVLKVFLKVWSLSQFVRLSFSEAHPLAFGGCLMMKTSGVLKKKNKINLNDDEKDSHSSENNDDEDFFLL